MRWLFLLLSLVLLGLSSLTVVPAWHVVVWQAAIVAGEYGHYLGLATLTLACAVVAYGVVAVEDGQPYWKVAVPAVGFALGATGLFWSPVAYGLRVGATLPGKFERGMGERPTGRAIDLRQMWLSGLEREAPGRRVTEVYTPVNWPEALAVDFYPAERAGAPVVVMVHGGGWDGGDRRQLDYFNHHLARAGYAVAAISYRLAPEYRWPAQREDTLQAVAWLQANAARLEIDATRIVLMGRSAGAQIAGAVAYGAEDPAIRGFIGLYGVYDLHFVWSISREDDVLNSVRLMTQYLGGAPSPENLSAYDSASAQGLVRPERTPPTLLLHGTVDTLCWVEHSRRLHRELSRAGVPHVYVELPWAVHAFDFNPAGPGGQITAYAVEVFLADVTAKSR